MIVLRSPKGWTAPAEVEGHKLEGSWRAHQVPLPDVKADPEQFSVLENWLRSHKPEELFDQNGRLIPELQRACANRHPAHGRQSHRQWRPSQEGSAPARFPGLCDRC